MMADSTSVVVENNGAKEQREFFEAKIGVKGLADSGITSIPPFFIHPPETLPTTFPTTTNMITSNSKSAQVPVIDLSGVDNTSGDHRSKIIHQIEEASRAWGVLYVTNHGIPTAVLDETIAAAKSFHEQPIENKTQLYPGKQQSYIEFANLNFKGSTWRDSLKVLWTPAPPTLDRIPAVCRKEVVAWKEHMNRLGETLMEVLSEGLGAVAGRLKELMCMDFKLMLLHYYPCCPQPDLTMGLLPHSDSSIITVLLQNQIGGLQVKHGQEWVDVKPVPGALLVFVGQLLQLISNDDFKSCEHRVLANCFREPRVTIAFFLRPYEGSSLHGPLPELLSPEKPPVYRNFTLHEFIKAQCDALAGDESRYPASILQK